MPETTAATSRSRGSFVPVLGRLQLVLLRASDLERSARFYRELLGVPLEPGDNRRPGDPWIGGGHHEYSWRDSYLHFSIYPGTAQEHTCGAHIGFEVEHLQSMHRRLVEAEVPVLHEPRAEPWGMTARYTDPDGNVVELVEPKR
jgi:catechol 2,3-dioxygenase-like lactoylglutathione lyase family enzyme